MRVAYLSAPATHDLRRRVLRGHLPGAGVEFPEDGREATVHLGVLDDAGSLVAAATAFPEATPHRPGARAVRLRGMAVDEGVQGRGVGRLLLDAVVDEARREGYEVVWANVRDTALGFYRGRGWEVVGEGFEALGLPHHVALLDLPAGPSDRGHGRKSAGAGGPAWQAAPMASLSEDLRFRGLVHQVTDPDLALLLDAGGLTAYAGFDPTAPSLQLGNLVGVLNLVRLQRAGHRPIALAGGGTGLVGDPSGKTEERALLTSEQLEANVAGIRAQLERFLDFGAGALLLDNGEWLRSIGLLEFLRDVGKHFTVNVMIAKESVRARLEQREQGISFTEFSYMLLQAYDFLRLFELHGCRLQLGGSDQWGNIVMGVDLVRRVRGEQVFGITTPLLTDEHGRKLGKTEAGAIWLDATRTSPYRLFQYLLNAPDQRVGAYLRALTLLPAARIEELDAGVAEHPERREAQRALAREVVTLVHGAGEADAAERAGRALFGEEIAALDEAALLDVLAEAPSSTLPRSAVEAGGLPLVQAMADCRLTPSRSAARKTVEQGGAYVNNRRETDLDRRLTTDDLLHGRYLVLRRGRRDHHLLRLE